MLYKVVKTGCVLLKVNQLYINITKGDWTTYSSPHWKV